MEIYFYNKFNFYIPTGIDMINNDELPIMSFDKWNVPHQIAMSIIFFRYIIHVLVSWSLCLI